MFVFLFTFYLHFLATFFLIIKYVYLLLELEQIPLESVYDKISA